MHSKQVIIEDWNGDGAIRLPDETLQELGLDVGDTLYIVETYIGNQKSFVLSTTPKIADRMDELVEELSHEAGTALR
ncbi:AbrB/MazE/SpoVT family DNA-binding domain-containing protein [Pseudomonas fluorescens]|uniref:AbrB/MazE/SpoVT family DNA-binding domain-containing protein n=1 Tax=Pseudomonas fluorescens TaxID=294 RepID=UPI001BE71F22|nr:AbrB/MazE/SpoVT family DNA-binding domain-containing protein [Pseudomonas fluorescens]MBT2374737.1 AbrB/MazE/SpoVT family DNA-binding domain-containing protein [Pseudomonas fluorescens]